MGLPHRLIAKQHTNQETVIRAYTKFVDLILSRVEKLGLEKVLSLRAEKTHEHFWVYKHYERILDFAEAVQLKVLPQQVDANVNATVTMGEITKEDKPLRFNIGDFITQDPGHTGQAPSVN